MKILTFKDVREEVLKEFTHDFEWPWQSLNDATHFLRRTELITVVGATGLGKSEMVNEIAFDLSQRQGHKVLLMSLESSASFTYRRLISKQLGVRIDKPKHRQSRHKIVEIGNGLNISMYDDIGIVSWDKTSEEVEHYVKAAGVDVIIIDNLSSLAGAFRGGGKTLAESLGDTTLAIKELAKRTNTLILLVAHVSRGDKTKGDFDKGRELSLSDVRSSEGVAMHSDYVFGFERNALAKDVEARNYCTVRGLKDRIYGTSRGEEFYFRYNHENGKLLECGKFECKIDKTLLFKQLYEDCIQSFDNLVKAFKKSDQTFNAFMRENKPRHTFEAVFNLQGFYLTISNKARPFIIFDAPHVLSGKQNIRRFAEVLKTDPALSLRWVTKPIDLSKQRLIFYFNGGPADFQDTMTRLLRIFGTDTVTIGENSTTTADIGFGRSHVSEIKMSFTLVDSDVPIEMPQDYMSGYIGSEVVFDVSEVL